MKKKLERIIALLAAGLTLIIFLTGLDLPTMLTKLQSTLNEVLQSRPTSDVPPGPQNLLFWLSISGLAAIISALGVHWKNLLREFLMNFLIITPLLFIVAAIWNFQIGEQFKYIFILVFLDAILIGSVLYPLVKYVNHLGHWPKEISTNLFFGSVLMGVPMIPVATQLGISIIIIGLVLSFIVSELFEGDPAKSRKKHSSRQKNDSL